MSRLLLVVEAANHRDYAAFVPELFESRRASKAQASEVQRASLEGGCTA